MSPRVQLWGAAVGAAAGSFSGALIGLSIPEYEAKRYEGKIIGGSALIPVHTTNSEATDQMKEIFEQANAADISSTEEASASSRLTLVMQCGAINK